MPDTRALPRRPSVTPAAARERARRWLRRLLRDGERASSCPGRKAEGVRR
jgi:hypothetical protein